MTDDARPWWAVWFKGGTEDFAHPETFGCQADTVEEAREEALRIMTEEFGIRYPEIYSIERIR